MSNYIITETETDEDTDSSESFISFMMKWPLTFIILITSLPAGAAPFFAAGDYQSTKHDEHVSPKWRNERRIESGKDFFRKALLVCAVTGLCHIVLVSLSLRKWNDLIFGLRGAFWFTLASGFFVLGMSIGIWVYMVCPD
jgi:hypothetical protein